MSELRGPGASERQREHFSPVGMTFFPSLKLFILRDTAEEWCGLQCNQARAVLGGKRGALEPRLTVGRTSEHGGSRNPTYDCSLTSD